VEVLPLNPPLGTSRFDQTPLHGRVVPRASIRACMFRFAFFVFLAMGVISCLGRLPTPPSPGPGRSGNERPGCRTG
jgi:hypothetical protein